MRYRPLLYPDAAAWRAASEKRVLLFGMSGLGKTQVSNLLRASGRWFHYSVDYRIGTRYMGELITDSFKREAMRTPYLRELLMSDSIYIASNITFQNLAPLSTYLGKPGRADLGGLSWDDYRRRQAEHRTAEIASLLDTTRFIDKAEDIYGYKNFICDSGGSICEVVDPGDPEDTVMTTLADALLLVWIEDTDAHRAELVRRFVKQPKPMYYKPEFLDGAERDYLNETSVLRNEVDPDDFMRWTFARALAHRRPLYAAMARNWGVSVTAEEVERVRTAEDFDGLIATALDRATLVSASDPPG